MKRFLFFLGLSLAACRQQSEVEETDPEAVRSELLPTEVKTAPVAVRPFPYLISTTGRIQAEWDVPILPLVSGVVKMVHVKTGDRVRRGEVLIELENSRQNLQVQRARLTVEERNVSFQDMLLGHRGKKDSVVSKIVLENIRLGSGLAAAELAYQEALLDYENTLVKATHDGVLTDWKVLTGNLVTTGEALGRIFSPGRFLIVCNLLEQDALRLTAKSTADLQVGGIVNRLEANRPEVNPRVDMKTNSVEVAFRIQGTPGLIPGLTAQITIRVPGHRALVVPKEAVIFRSGKPVVFSLENGLAKWNYVKTGSENGKEIEITEGLSEEMTVIVTNNLQLAHDAPVKAI